MKWQRCRHSRSWYVKLLIPRNWYHWVVSTPVESGHGKAAWLVIQELESGLLKSHIIATHNIDASLVNDVCRVDTIHGQAARTRTLVSIQNTSADPRTKNDKSSGTLSLLAVP